MTDLPLRLGVIGVGTIGAEMVAIAAETGLVNALNYTLSDRSAAVEVVRAVRAGEVGDVLGVDIQLLFPEWPRDFQKEARWVAGREQGGFLREVGSHYVFLTDRYGSHRSYRITNWGDLYIGDADGWTPVTPPGPRGGEGTRLADFVGAVRGRPSTLADFAAGLRVQRAIEAFHATE